MAQKSVAKKHRKAQRVTSIKSPEQATAVEKPLPGRLPSAFKIARQSLDTIWSNRKLFGGMCLVYLVLNVIFVRGFSSGADLTELKTVLADDQQGLGHLVSGLALFGVLLTSSGNATGQTAGAYQSFVLVIVSLALVWALRMVRSGEPIRMRDAFYKGMYPLIPFLLVLFVIVLALLPLVIGATFYSIVVSNGVASSLVEQAIFALLFFGLALISLYLISSTIIALYIAALPDMTPLKALRSARQLVKGRRWSVIRKQLFLPLVLLVSGVVIMLPFLLLLTPLAPWVFFGLTAVAVVLVHTYLYTLYRELLP